MANLAVVGAGIAGCSVAYFARKYLSETSVTIYDAQDRIGGRILTHNSSGISLELGATFLTGFNKTLVGIIKAEHLKMAPEERTDFAVWNGSELVFRSNKQSLATGLKLLTEYKMSLGRIFLLLREVKAQFTRLYKEQLKKPADMDELFESTCVGQWHKKTFLEVLIERGIRQNFVDEIVTPITRIIYSQNAGIGGLAGISSLIGVSSGATYSLAGGNSTLPIHLAETSNATIKLGEKVDAIEKTPKGNYRVYTGNDMAVFDTVIIATPLELADIKFDRLSVPGWNPQSYQSVYRKVMRGVFDPDYFGLKNSAAPPVIVLTTEAADPITHYSIQRVSNGESLVTISSTEPLNYEVFNGVFKNSGVPVLEHCWNAAYPIFKPVAKLPPTRIDEGLMYISAIEPSISSMETSALSALNAVRMLCQE